MAGVSKVSLEHVDLEGKRVFLRADFNVPLAGDAILDDARLRAALPTIRYCQDKGACIVLAAHLGRPKGKRDPALSLKPVAFRLEELLGEVVPLAPDCVGPLCERLAGALWPGQLLLLENLRFREEEEANDPSFARALARLADCYVNDAFSASHRKHASLVAITQFLQPAAAGLLMQRELAALGRLTGDPKRPVVIVLGGARVSEKLGLIRQILQRADRLLIGGGMAFTFLRALGHVTGQSLVEPKLIPVAREILAEAAARRVEVLLPEDLVVSTYPGDQVSVRVNPVGGIGLAMMGLDIGPRTVVRFRKALQDAGTVVWNGPMGLCGIPAFAAGTTEMAKTIAECRAYTVAGGGDTVAAIAGAGLAAKFSYLSMAGAAFLEYMEGRELPGVAALTDARPAGSRAASR